MKHASENQHKALVETLSALNIVQPSKTTWRSKGRYPFGNLKVTSPHFDYDNLISRYTVDESVSFSKSAKSFLIADGETRYAICVSTKLPNKLTTPSKLGLNQFYDDEAKFLVDVRDAVSRLPAPFNTKCATFLESYLTGKPTGLTKDTSTPVILKDFGEVIAALHCLREGGSIEFPSASNAQLYDLIHEKNGVRTLIPVKSAGGSGSSLRFAKDSIDEITNVRAREIFQVLTGNLKGVDKFVSLVNLNTEHWMVEKLFKGLSTHHLTSETLNGLTQKGEDAFSQRFGDYFVDPTGVERGRPKTLDRTHKNIVMFSLLTTIIASLNGETELVDTLKNLLTSRNISYAHILHNDGVVKVQRYDAADMKFKFHYWGNVGGPLLNHPGFCPVLEG
jgi:small nuclear ribonucleoprotein (snRNP)-like protein